MPSKKGSGKATAQRGHSKLSSLCIDKRATVPEDHTHIAVEPQLEEESSFREDAAAATYAHSWTKVLLVMCWSRSMSFCDVHSIRVYITHQPQIGDCSSHFTGSSHITNFATVAYRRMMQSSVWACRIMSIWQYQDQIATCCHRAVLC